MKQILLVVDRRFVSQLAVKQLGENFYNVGVQAMIMQVAQQSRPVEVYSLDNLPEAHMDVIRKFIEDEAVVKQ